MTFLKKYISVYSILLVIAVSFVGGFYAGRGNQDIVVVNDKGEPVESGTVTINRSDVKSYLGKDVDFDLFLTVWDMLRTRYVDQPVSQTKLFYGALEGMVSSLDDPYSVFLTPKVSEQFTESLSGRFEGIGAEIGLKHELITVVSPLDGSPAQSAGLLAKDIVLKIDGVSTENMGLDEAVNRIRGEKGTQVTLAVAREGEDAPLDIKITRDTIRVKSVSWEMLDGGYAHITMRNFNTDTTTLFRDIQREILAQNPKGIIFDLRNNSGGFLQTAVDVASAWVDNDVVVIERSTSPQDAGLLPVISTPGSAQAATSDSTGPSDLFERVYKSNGKPAFKGIPTVVLVNGGSASASEIVAGALQDYEYGYLVGEQTYGKGSVQVLEDLPDGSSVKFTVAKWYTPKDRSIDKNGIIPNETVALSSEDYSEDKDPQLDRAVGYLKDGPSSEQNNQ